MDKLKHENNTLPSDNIGTCIQKARKSKKISQKELAKMIGMSERTIQKYESGEIDISLSMIKLIADELDMPWKELINFTSNTPNDYTDTTLPVQNEYKTLGDVISVLLSFDKINEVSFTINCTKPPEESGWTSSITIDGHGEGSYNSSLCLFMENWMNKLRQLNSNKISKDEYNKWKQLTISYYSSNTFSEPATKD